MSTLANGSAKYFHNQIKLWNEWMEHGDYDGTGRRDVPANLRRFPSQS
jgi:hypothetical protein